MNLKEAIKHIEDAREGNDADYEWFETAKDTEAYNLILAAAKTQLPKTKKQYGVTTRHSDYRGTRVTLFKGQPEAYNAVWCPYNNREDRDGFAKSLIDDAAKHDDANFIGLDLTEMDVPV